MTDFKGSSLVDAGQTLELEGVSDKPTAQVANAYRYGHFNHDGTEFVVTDPKTPRAFDNFLWNRSVFSNVQQTGVGYMDYQVGDTEGIQLFTGVGRICDFDVFGRDHLMSRLVYVRDNQTGTFWNMNWEPVCRPYDAFRCTHGIGYSILQSRVEDVESGFRIFVPDGEDPVELWTLELQNEASGERDFTVFVYNQLQFRYKWGFDSYGDMLYRGVWFDAGLNSLVASKHPFRRPHDHLMAFMTSTLPITAFDGSRDAFVGIYNTLAKPQAVERGRCSNTRGSSEATIGAIQFDIKLAPGERKKWSVLVGAANGEEGIQTLRERYLGKEEKEFETLKTRKEAVMTRQVVETPDPHFDRIINHWVKQAALFGSAWCRWGWNGYRDIVQHGLGVAAIEPNRTQEILTAALSHQYASGVAPRGWNPIDEKPYSDSALWLIFTLVAYLKETGDFAYLDKEIPYLDGGAGPVHEHIERALQFLEDNKGKHDLCLIKFGDWNDSLTGVGKDGKGESVWLSQAYAEALREMAALMAHLGKTRIATHFTSRRKAMLDAINTHAWDGAWYKRCFDDDGNPVGSESNEFARIFMETQSWGLISGAADSERADSLIAACDEILATPNGYLLLAPPYTRLDEKVGRLSSLEPGICENGTVYSHLNVWMILGLLRYGHGDKAYDVFRKVTPGYVTDPEDLKQRCPPFMYANCYYGPGHHNNAFQMEFTWITGSVAWFNTVLIQEMLGVRADYDGLIIDPCLPAEWPSCRVEREFRGSRYDIEILNPSGFQRGKITLEVDGVAIQGNKIPAPTDGRPHKVVATISAA